jgi:predicted RNase H-like HicB family nuclease
MENDIIIIPEGNGKDKIYSISSIQVPNVVTQGKTLEEAKRRLKEALELYSEETP